MTSPPPAGSAVGGAESSDYSYSDSDEDDEPKASARRPLPVAKVGRKSDYDFIRIGD